MEQTTIVGYQLSGKFFMITVGPVIPLPHSFLQLRDFKQLSLSRKLSTAFMLVPWLEVPEVEVGVMESMTAPRVSPSLPSLLFFSAKQLCDTAAGSKGRRRRNYRGMSG